MRHIEPMGKAVELGTAVDALAALAALTRIRSEGLPADARVEGLLEDVAAELLGGPLSGADPAAAPLVGLARTVVRQAAELIENPGRQGAWDQVDVPLLQSIGRLSTAIAGAVQAAEAVLEPLAVSLTAPGSTFLDVGTGTGWLAVAMARSHPGLRIVGIDIFDAALALARENVSGEGLSDRIELRHQDVTQLDGRSAYDAVWLPLPFLPAGIVPRAMVSAREALRPGGWLLAGTFTGSGERLSELLSDLRTVRSGGHPWRGEELADVIGAAGLTDVREIPRTWAAPVRLHVGRRPGPAGGE